MKAILCPQPGGDLSTLYLADCVRPVPGQGDVCVRVQAASLNPVDWKLCTGVAPWWEGPMIVGVDGAGVVETLGPGVNGPAPGTRVAWHHDLRRPGTFAEYVTVPAHVLATIPDSVSFEAAAALPCAGMTAYQGLVRKAHVAQGQTVLVQGASGGTGGYAVQIAKAKGATVIALARPEHDMRVRRLGADHVLDYRAPDLVDQVRAYAPDGVDLFYEVVKPSDATKSFRHIRYNGQFVTTDPLPDLSAVPPYTYALSIHEVALGGAYGAEDLRTQSDFSVMLGEMLDMVAAGRLDPMISERIAFADIPDALQRLKDRAVVGKIVAVLPKEGSR